jgi:hypothetical protein
VISVSRAISLYSLKPSARFLAEGHLDTWVGRRAAARPAPFD